MTTVLTFSGKARQVFRYLALLARYHGHVTVGDLKKGREQDGHK